MDLRPYQVESIEHVRQKLRDGKKKILVVAPTGSGKTVMFSDILSRAAEKGSRSLVLAHRRELIQQTSEKLHRFGARHGVIQAGTPRALQHGIQVASVQSLGRNPGILHQVDLVVVDEAHHFTASNTYQKILSWWPKAVLLGFTATPWRLDGAGLSDIFDSHVIVRTPRQLRDEGFLVGVTGWEYAPIDTQAAKVSGGDFVGKSLEAGAMSTKLFGEIISDWKQHAGGARSVLFACTIDHSVAMARAFCVAGVQAEHLDGETPAAQRAGILARIASGQTRVLCNVNVATEGWDCPELECVMLCRPTLSTSLFLQMVGRVLRPAEGKTVARIHDHARCLASHGHPYSDRDWNPEHSSKAPRAAADEPSVKRGRRCPGCKAVIVSYPCDGCGYMPNAKEIETERRAEKKAITNTPAWEAAKAKLAKQRQDAAAWAGHSRSTKKQMFEGLQRRLGTRAATGAYRRMSGETEWPDFEWRVEPNVVEPL